MSRRRRLRISLLIGAIPAVAIAIGGLWGTAEEGGLGADTCGSIVHRTSDSAICRAALTETYVEKLVAAAVIGLALAALVFGALTLVRWIRRGRRPGSWRWRLGLVGAVVVVLVLGTTTTVVVAHREASDSCQPASTPGPVATADRVELPLGDAAGTGQVAITSPHGSLVARWCSHAEAFPTPVGSLPAASDGVLYLSTEGPAVAVDLATGRTRWTSSAIGEPRALVGDDLLVRGYDQVYSVDAGTGRVRWTADDAPGASKRDSPTSPGDLTGTGGRVYVTSEDLSSDDADLRVIDQNTGRVERDRQLGSRLSALDSTPVVAGGLVVVATEEGAIGQSTDTRVQAFDATTLTPRWSDQVDGQIDRLLLVDGQVVAKFEANDGTHLLDRRLADGEPAWSLTVSRACGVESILATPDLVIATVAGHASCAGTHAYDPTSGDPRWTAADVGRGWISGGRVVGINTLLTLVDRGVETEVSSVDAASGVDFQVVARLAGDNVDATALVGGLVLSTENVHGLQAYGPR